MLLWALWIKRKASKAPMTIKLAASCKINGLLFTCILVALAILGDYFLYAALPVTLSRSCYQLFFHGRCKKSASGK